MTRQDTITAANGPFNEDLGMVRDQLRRFIETEVTAKADAWEETGMVPRDVLRRMGDLGLLGMRYGEEYGGAGLDVGRGAGAGALEEAAVGLAERHAQNVIT